MEVVRIEAKVKLNGCVVVENLPFDEGETVEITIEGKDSESRDNLYPLRGTPYTYNDPFEPIVPADDWEVMR